MISAWCWALGIDHAASKRKLHHVNSSKANEDITLCELNYVHYMEMETSDIVVIVTVDSPKVQCVEPFVKDSANCELQIQ